jgi:hypothetical protein
MTLWFRWSPTNRDALSGPPAGAAQRFSPLDLRAPIIDASKKSVTFCTLGPNEHVAVEEKLDALWEKHEKHPWEEFERRGRGVLRSPAQEDLRGTAGRTPRLGNPWW